MRGHGSAVAFIYEGGTATDGKSESRLPVRKITEIAQGSGFPILLENGNTRDKGMAIFCNRWLDRNSVVVKEHVRSDLSARTYAGHGVIHAQHVAFSTCIAIVSGCHCAVSTVFLLHSAAAYRNTGLR
jgi:hypothetical protein